KSGSGYTHALGFNTLIQTSFANVTTLDLQLVGDAATGKVQAYYSINGQGFSKFTQELTLGGAKKDLFFSSAGRAGIIALHKNNLPPITATYDEFKIEAGTAVAARPAVTAARVGGISVPTIMPVPRDSFIAADVSLPTPGAGVDTTTLSSDSVKLYRASDHAPIGAVLNTSGGGDAIVLTPTEALDPGVTYTFEVTDLLKDTSGAAFIPYTVTFTTNPEELQTDPTLAFQKVALPTATGHTYTGVTFGPDGKLYASTIDGLIQRFTVNPDGTLGTPQNITSLQTKEGGATLLIGMAFDPASTASNLILWVSHSQYTDVNAPVADDFTGKISKLTGANLQTVTTAVVNLPRSVRDHMTNQLKFGPDGAIYFNQGANSAMGAPDNAWGLRSEHLLNSAILRLDTSKLPTTGALDVKTPDVGGTYNPFDATKALTIYATGVRNAYDLVWTSSGRLFAATNGSAAGGSTPSTPSTPGYSFGPNERIDYPTRGAYTGPNVGGITNLPQTQNDYLFNVVKGGYYGQPNPARGEFVLNGGNPTSSADGVTEVSAYPVGTQPDRNYRGNNTGMASKTLGSAYSFGKNYSPNGIIEYQGTAFNNALKGKLLVAEYSGGDDIVVLTPDNNGNIISAKRGIAGLTHFTDPLDIIEDPNTGFLYIAEYGGQRLTLVRPIAPGANIETDKSQMVFNDITAAGASAVQKIRITNTGTSALALPPDGLQILGAGFAFVNKPAAPYPEIAPGDSLELSITFTAGATAGVIHTATLQIKSNDPDQTTILLPLRGLAMSSLAGGTNEPSLQKVMDLYRIPIKIGDSNPATTELEFPLVTPNDEVLMQALQKVGSGPVTIESLAVFGVGSATVPTFRFGHYTPGNPNDTSELLKVIGNTANNLNNSQSVNPNIIGQTSFDPGAGAFGLYTFWQNFSGAPTVFSEDALNKTYDADTPHKVRFYTYKTPDGTVVPDAFIFAFEEFNNSTDQQDYVGIIRNVRAAPVGSGAEIGFENLDGPTFNNHLAFNRIQQPANTSPVPDNIVHDKAVLRIRNTGIAALDISSIATSAGWIIEGLTDTTPTIAAGGELLLNIRFNANPGGTTGKVLNGTLTINSNDLDEATSTISLSGYWQPENENNKEPSLQQIFNIAGYKTIVAHTGQTLGQGNGGRIGDEVRSGYWNRADTTLPVAVRQLAAWHGQGNTERFGWHLKTSSTVTTVFTHDGEEGQSFLPHLNNGVTSSTGAGYAAGTFSPSATFGFKIQGASLRGWSDPLRNDADQWETRLWVARDVDGAIIPNAYLMTMDYFGTEGTNYDFNDNVYLITNIKPENAPSAPTGLGASASGAGIALNWDDNTEANLVGYNVYRGSAAAGPFTKLNSTLIESSEFVDVAAPLGQTSYYIIKAVDNVGNESGNNAAIGATRTTDTAPPAIPKSFTASGSATGIQLNWADNTDSDFAGYNLFRATSLDGPWTQLNVSLLTSSSYFDSGAASNVTTYYHVEAVDTSGNKSAPATASGTRTSSDTTAPAQPTGLTPTPSSSGISLDWADTNTETDFAGYNVYRIENGARVKLNTSGLLGVSQFIDTGAPAGVLSSYEVVAVDTSNNESTAATTSATRPADATKPAAPTGIIVNANTNGITLNWDDNTETDLAGYNVYRSDAIGGPWTKLNTTGLLTSSIYVDTTAIADQVSYYQITAVDASTNESDPAAASGTRPVPDTIMPAAPAGLVATVQPGGTQLGWADNIESDLAGYNVYRATSETGTYVKLNTSGLLTSSDYFDITAPSGTSWYRVTAVDASNNESDFAVASATHLTTYTHTEIGNPTPAGSLTTVTDGSDYNLTAGGADIFGTSDSFGFSYRQITGDFDMRVRVAGLTAANAWTKAGLMARESLVANSRNVFALISASNGHRLTSRATTGGASASTGSGAATFPNNWLRLARVGNVFTAYRSTDGATWTSIGAVTIAMPQTVFFGLAATSHNTAATTTAQFRDLSVNGSTPVDEPPAAPTNITTNATTGGIALNWDDNTESDLAGYNIYRATSASGPWTKLNTSGLLASSQFNDTTAPSGSQSFYRVAAVDNATQESAFALASATRPNTPTLPTGPFKINFQVVGSPAVAGYIQDNGAVFDDRGSGVSYGWNVNHTDLARDRNKNTDQLVDTLVHMHAGASWSIDIANGTYNVKVSVGDSGYATTNTINVNGVNFWTNQAQAINTFASKTLSVTVTNGKMTLDNGAAADLATRINYIEISAAPVVVAPTKINFQLAGSPAVAGYLQDNGAVFGDRGNGSSYGWNVNHTDLARDRNKNTNQLLDTLVHMHAGANWSIALANGTYNVKVSVGDSQYATTNTVSVNGVNFWTNLAVGANAFANKTVQVTVTNGKLTLTNSASPDLATRLNYIEITQV
ncbi:MAG: large repetitive protein, partial [Phycisphaerales bacterium]|nr:large repetitive protein [Phycisphaerales bacterium]